MGTLNLGRVRGSMWYMGDGINGTAAEETIFPESGISAAYEGDGYMNPDTGNIYQCAESGDADTAKWIYRGNLKGPMPELEDGFNSTSKSKGMTANAGRILKKMIDEAGIYAKSVVPSCDEVIHVISMHMENVSTVITVEDVEGNIGTYSYTKSEAGAETDITIPVSSSIGMSEGAVIKSIKSSEAHIYSYSLYNGADGVMYEETPDLWEDISNLKEDILPSTSITEDTEDGEADAMYRTGIISRMINGIRKTVFPVTHAKAVWWNKFKNKTVHDKIEEDCIQYDRIVKSATEMASLGQEDAGKFVADAREVGRQLEAINTDLNNKVDETDPRLTDARTPKAHNHDERYYTESEVNTMLSGLGMLNPRVNKVVVGSTPIDLPAGSNLAHKIFNFDKNVQIFMPFISYNDSCFNCPVFIYSGISGSSAYVNLIPESAPSSAYSYNIWYMAVVTK